MSEEAFDQATGALADLTERAVAYADVWRSAITRNAQGDYKAEHFLVDLQALWGMSTRDAARIGAAAVEAMAPLIKTDTFASEPPAPTGS